MDVQFIHPYMLMLAWLVPVLVAWWVWILRRREQALRSFMSDDMQKKLRPTGGKARVRWQLGLLAGGMLLTIVAAARPQWGTREEVVFTRGRDLVIALDVSRSMLAADVHPNRLERAKTDLLDLIRDLRGDRAALMAFRKNAVMLCPLTTDYAYLREVLDGADIDSARPGETDIGAAIESAMDAFESETATHQAIVLISDGEDLEGNATAAAQKAAEKGITIFTVGLGSRGGATVSKSASRPGQKDSGETVVTKLDDATLDAIASITGGAYVPLGTASTANMTLGTLYSDHLRRIKDQDIEETLARKRIDRFQWVLLPGVLMLLMAAGLSRGRLARSRINPQEDASVPPPPPPLRDLSAPSGPLKQLSLMIAACALASPLAMAETNTVADVLTPEIPPGRAGARVAQSLYQSGDYLAAGEAYLQAAAGASADAQQQFRYNAAASFFRADAHERAADILRGLDTDAERLPVSESLGASLFEAASQVDPENEDAFEDTAELLKASAEAFREAARDRDDEHALSNLAIARQAAQAAEDDAKIQDLLRRYQQSDAGQVIAEMLKSQREVSMGMTTSMTNTSPSRIQQLEAIARQQKDAAELWIPLKGKLLEAASQSPDMDEQKLAEMNQMIEATRDNMMNAADRLADLDPEAEQAVGLSEATIYGIWKSVASHDSLLSEDMRLQTNVIRRLSNLPTPELPSQIPTGPAQDEAKSLTELFIERFSQAVPEQAPESPMPSPDAAGLPQEAGPPPLDPETRAKIIDLAHQAVARQTAVSSFLEGKDAALALAEAQASHALLKEIESLLPKQDNQQQQNQQDQQDQQDQQQDNEQQPQEQPPEASGDEQEEPQPPEESPEEPEEQEAASPEDEQEATPEEVQQLLERALQREREHTEEQRRRQRSIPLAPSVRDW